MSFKWPYPNRDWAANARPLEAMQIVHKAMMIFSTPEPQWQDDHNAFFIWMVEAVNKNNG